MSYRLAAVLLVFLAGCPAGESLFTGRWPAGVVTRGQVQTVPLEVVYPNPALFAAVDRKHLWEQLADVVNDYFRIEREQRPRAAGNVLTEGRIDTFPLVAATVLEPWRGDSASGHERIESTLQSIRRRALVRVAPEGRGYRVEVVVEKELEDLHQPQHAAAAAAVLRHDSAAERDDADDREKKQTLGWIPLGRDTALEQRILAELHRRMAGTPAP